MADVVAPHQITRQLIADTRDLTAYQLRISKFIVKSIIALQVHRTKETDVKSEDRL